MAAPLFLPQGEHLYHYTAAAKLAMILHSGRLRLGPYAGTRDPRENLQWHSSYSAPEDARERWPDWDMFAMSAQIDEEIRHRAKLTCLTLDRRSDDPQADMFARGYGRARMWEQYADEHRGAVLVFDRAALDEAVRSRLSGKGPLFSGPVQYRDHEWDHSMALSFDLEQLMEPDGMATAVEAVVTRHHRSLFFGKNCDWATEQEYRYVVLTDAPYEEVDIRNSVVGLVLGMYYPEHEESVLRYRLEQVGLSDIPLMKMNWFNGLPICFPAHH